MVVRAIILLLGLGCLIGLLAAAAHGAPAPFLLWLGVIGVILTIAGVFERVKSGLSRQKPGAGWIETKERFVDESSGKLVTVFYKPETGERSYYRHD